MSATKLEITSDSPLNGRSVETSREDLVRLLEFEINHIRTEEARPGWSTWALIAGLATMLWLLSHELQESKPDIDHTLLVFLLVSITYDALKIFSKFLKDIPVGKGRFVTIRAQLSPGRSRLMVDAARNVALIAIAVHLRGSLGRAAEILIVLYYGFDTLADLLGLLLSYTDFTVPKQPQTPRLAMNVRIGGLALGCFAALGSAFAFSNFKMPPQPELRLGGLLFAIGIVVLLVTRSQPKTPLLETLVQIRRAVGLGQLDLDSARRQVDIALEGMNVSDVLQSRLVSLLADLERSGVHLETAANEVNAFALTMKTSSQPLTQTGQLVPVIKQSVNHHLEEAKAGFDSFNSKLRVFQTRVHTYDVLSPSSRPSLLSLRKSLDEAVAAFQSKRARLMNTMAEFETMTKRVKSPMSGYEDSGR
jgi:hypothetical protein